MESTLKMILVSPMVNIELLTLNECSNCRLCCSALGRIARTVLFFFFSTNTQNTEFCSFAGAVVVANVDVKSLLAASSARFNRIVHAFDCRVECSLQESKQYRRLVESLQIIVQFVLIKTRLRL